MYRAGANTLDCRRVNSGIEEQIAIGRVGDEIFRADVGLCENIIGWKIQAPFHMRDDRARTRLRNNIGRGAVCETARIRPVVVIDLGDLIVGVPYALADAADIVVRRKIR